MLSNYITTDEDLIKIMIKNYAIKKILLNDDIYDI